MPSSAVELLRLRLHEEALTKVTESSTILDDMGEHAERATILQSLGEVGGRKGVLAGSCMTSCWKNNVVEAAG